MNKIAIPALMVAIVMVAGAFAFIPIEQASTVHTSQAGADPSTQTILLEDLTGLNTDGGTDVDFAELIIFYDGIGEVKSVDLEVNTNIAASILPNDSTADLYLLQTADSSGVWTDAGDWGTASGGRHMDVANSYGLRILLVDDGSAPGALAFGTSAYITVTVIQGN